MNTWDTRYVTLDSIEFSVKKNLRRLEQAQFFTLTDSNDLILDLFSGRCDTSYGLKEKRQRIINGDLSFNLLTINTDVTNKIQLDALHLPFRDNQFDAVIIQGGLHHLAALDQIIVCLNEVKRILKYKGYVFISEPANTVLLTIWLFIIKKTSLWQLTSYSRNWHNLYKAEEHLHATYLSNVQQLTAYFQNSWVIHHHKKGLITEFFTLTK
jgi:ubiquinone/menaquinone biosynthesis C-methylase UbiE